MAQIILRDLAKQFGSFTAVKGINLEVRDGEFLIMVGPSGCGKTTTLNMISGLVMPTSGEIRIGKKVVTHTEPERGLGMVFQDLALFPHMSVYDNIAFGLRVKQLDRAEIDRRVRASAEAMHISALLDKQPGQCSGAKHEDRAGADDRHETFRLSDGRTALQPRRQAQGRHAHRAQESAWRAWWNVRVCNPRSGRGHDHG